MRFIFRLVFLLFGIARTADLFAQAKEVPGIKPNILWLVAEDISPFLASYGDSTARTPNLDRLAKEGVRYSNVFDVSGVCAPSRSCLITGMYPTSIGTNNMRTLNAFPTIGIPKYSVVLPPQVKMFSELMRKAGYYCTNNNKQDYQFVAPRSGWDESSNKAHWRNGPKDKPFFAVFNFNVTHESQIWEKKDDPLLVDPAKVPLPPYFPESPVIRKDVARMYSNIMEMDKQVGDVLKQLEDDGLLEKTIVVWYSDNGGPLPRSKREIYDTGLHVPMIIRFPDKKNANTVQDQLISFVDFAPSTLALARVPVPAYMQGQISFGINKPLNNRKYIYAARDRMDSEYDMVRTARDNRYKFIKNFQPEKPYMQNILYRKDMALMQELLKFEAEGKLNGVQQLWFRKSKPQEEFYDTLNDPYELNNLISDPSQKSKISELRIALENWIKSTGDKGFIPEKKWIESFWPGMKQPATADPIFASVNGFISVKSHTEGASVSYQVLTKNDQPDEKRWLVYTKPIKLNNNQKLAAIAERIGFKSSAVKEFSLTN